MDEKDYAASVAMDAAIVRKALNNLMGIVNGLVCDNNLTETEIHSGQSEMTIIGYLVIGIAIVVADLAPIPTPYDDWQAQRSFPSGNQPFERQNSPTVAAMAVGVQFVQMFMQASEVPKSIMRRRCAEAGTLDERFRSAFVSRFLTCGDASRPYLVSREPQSIDIPANRSGGTELAKV